MITRQLASAERVAMTATIQPEAEVINLRPDPAATRVAAIVRLASDVADANDARCKTGLPLTLWPSDRLFIAGLLPYTDPAAARAVLIGAAEWVIESRAEDRSDSEIASFAESVREDARVAVTADIEAAARTTAPAVPTPVPQAVTVAVEHSAATVTRTDDRCVCGHAQTEHKGGDQYCNGWTDRPGYELSTTPCGCAWFVLGGGAA